jgi:hypothetical protein
MTDIMQIKSMEDITKNLETHLSEKPIKETILEVTKTKAIEIIDPITTMIDTTTVIPSQFSKEEMKNIAVKNQKTALTIRNKTKGKEGVIQEILRIKVKSHMKVIDRQTKHKGSNMIKEEMN